MSDNTNSMLRTSLQNIRQEKFLQKRTLLKILVFLAVILVVWTGMHNDYFLYHKTIANVRSTRQTYIKTQTGSDGTYEYDEKLYRQHITAVIKNGKYKGQTVQLTSEYSQSQVYDTKYNKGDSIFVDTVRHSSSGLRANVVSVKRDYLIVTILAALFGLFLLVGGRLGILTIFSLVLNMAAFYWVLVLYTKGHNILYMTIPMTVFFTIMLLFFMLGKNEKTLIASIATLVTVGAVTLLSAVVMHFSGRIDFDFMDYLSQPYSQGNANLIFLSEVLVGGLGAVMDVVVTMVMTVSEIVQTGEHVTRKSLIRSCRSVGDDLVGTMINLMFLTNIASCIPAFILYMRNGIHFSSILHYNVFFELARFLTGSIGTVLAIPVAAFIAISWYEHRHLIERDPSTKNKPGKKTALLKTRNTDNVQKGDE
jgi:uncharacterized membrane protein